MQKKKKKAKHLCVFVPEKHEWEAKQIRIKIHDLNWRLKTARPPNRLESPPEEESSRGEVILEDLHSPHTWGKSQWPRNSTASPEEHQDHQGAAIRPTSFSSVGTRFHIRCNIQKMSGSQRTFFWSSAAAGKSKLETGCSYLISSEAGSMYCKGYTFQLWTCFKHQKQIGRVVSTILSQLINTPWQIQASYKNHFDQWRSQKLKVKLVTTTTNKSKLNRLKFPTFSELSDLLPTYLPMLWY